MQILFFVEVFPVGFILLVAALFALGMHFFRCPPKFSVLLLIFILGLVIRFWVTGSIIGFNQTRMRSDDRKFEGIGWTLAQTGRYAETPEKPPTARSSPVLPVVLAGIYWLFGHQQAIAKGVLIFISASTIIVAFFLGQEIGNSRVGLLAALMVALDPFAWIFSGIFYSETLFTFFITASALFLLRALRQPRWGNLLLLGSVLGICALTRPNGLGIAMAAGLLLLVDETQDFFPRLRHASVVMGIVLIFMLPWVGRNYWVFHRFIPTTSQSGEVLLGFYNSTCLKYRCNEWIGFNTPPEAKEYRFSEMDEMTRNDVQIELAMASIRAYPLEWLTLLPAKVVRFWTHDLILPNTEYHSYPPLSFSSLQIIYYHYLLILGLVGLFMLYFTGHRREFIVFMSFLSVFIVIVLLFWGDARIRMPLHPLLAVAGAFAVATAYSWWAGKCRLLRE